MKLKLSIFLLLVNFLYASSINSALNGNTGVLETPNARIMPDWHMRFFVNRDEPFTYYGFAGSPLPFLEANFHVTQLSGIDLSSNPGWSGYGDYKDKAVNVKLQLKKESKYLPAIVIGGDDIWGTALYTSKYIVATKRISYFDVSLGYAKGRLGGEKITSSVSSNSGSSNNRAFNFLKETEFLGGKPFGSVVFSATPNLTLMAEYSPIDYSNDYINAFASGEYDLPKSKFNFGAKYDIGDNSTLTLAYQRGNTFSFGYSYQFGFDRTGLFEHIPDPKWRADKKKKAEYVGLDEKQLSDKLSKEVAAENFRDVQTSVHKNKIWSEIENTRYNNDIQALGRAILTVDEVAPKEYDTIYMTLKQKNAKLKTLKVNRKEFNLFEKYKLSADYMKDAVVIDNDSKKLYEEFSEGKKVYKSEKEGFQRFNYEIGGKVRSYLNDPSDPFAVRVGVEAKVNVDLGEGFYFDGSIEHPIYNTIKDIVDRPMGETNELSVKSNNLEYIQYNDTQLSKLTLTHVRNIPFNSLAKVEVGYFDYAFAGGDFELSKSFFDERLTLGLQYQKVYKRKVDDLFAIYNNYSYDAKFINSSMLISPKYNMFLDIKYGEFLAGDKGVRFDILRSYKNFTIGAFATFTNSEEVFSSVQNKGYIDKGVYIKMPIEMFTYKNMKGLLNYGLTPWTRDVGQFADTSYQLYKLNSNENNTQIMRKYIEKLRE